MELALPGELHLYAGKFKEKMKNTKPAIFLDRDGTLIEDNGYIGTISKIQFFEETIPALKKLQKHFLLFIVTNQSGISKGLIEKKQVDSINNYIEKVLRKKGIEICKTYCCPHDSIDNCKCKKPKPFFLLKAATKYNIDLKKSFVIGDHPCDIQLALNAKATGIYLKTGHGKKHINNVPENTIILNNILKAATFIHIYNNL